MYILLWSLFSVASTLTLRHYYDLEIVQVIVFFLLPMLLAYLVKLDLNEDELKIKLSFGLVVATQITKFITRYVAVKLGLAPLGYLYHNWFDFHAPVIKQLVYAADLIGFLAIKFALFYSALTLAGFLQKKLSPHND
jgi:hypothetical protein